MLNFYSVFDKKVVSYGTPFLCRNHAEACRSFGDLAQDKRTTVGQHPGDFALYVIGRFDSESGQIQPCIPEVVAEAVQFVPAVEEPSS